MMHPKVKIEEATTKWAKNRVREHGAEFLIHKLGKVHGAGWSSKGNVCILCPSCGWFGWFAEQRDGKIAEIEEFSLTSDRPCAML